MDQTKLSVESLIFDLSTKTIEKQSVDALIFWGPI